MFATQSGHYNHYTCGADDSPSHPLLITLILPAARSELSLGCEVLVNLVHGESAPAARTELSLGCEVLVNLVHGESGPVQRVTSLNILNRSG